MYESPVGLHNRDSSKFVLSFHVHFGQVVDLVNCLGLPTSSVSSCSVDFSRIIADRRRSFRFFSGRILYDLPINFGSQEGKFSLRYLKQIVAVEARRSSMKNRSWALKDTQRRTGTTLNLSTLESTAGTWRLCLTNGKRATSKQLKPQPHQVGFPILHAA